ncbi:hypothetical protein AX14_002272 [Amanita brunnescens Koide BX004]|nr:hypothetical protein AX14_002272 [Amanita brunnescens Koide BX004]
MFEGQAELRVNLQWIQVARVKKLRPDEKHENVELSATMLKTVQSNFKVDYDERHLKDRNWDWTRADVGQDQVTVLGLEPGGPGTNSYRKKEHHQLKKQKQNTY